MIHGLLICLNYSHFLIQNLLKTSSKQLIVDSLILDLYFCISYMPNISPCLENKHREGAKEGQYYQQQKALERQLMTLILSDGGQ